MQVQVAGIPWFSADDYDSFRAALPDRVWHATYAEWLQAAEQTKKRLEQQGIRIVEAHVHSAGFVGWCRNTGRNVDAKALTAFANEAAARVAMGMENH